MAAYSDPTKPIVLIVDEAKVSLIGASRSPNGSVRIVARSYDVDDSQTGVELSYWANPENGGVPTVGDRLLVTIERAEPF
jgi:hypothetical protein